MTDEEVKKGLECCAESSCSKRNDCPYKSKMPKNDGYIFCQQRKDKDARALINRLEAEKEEVRKETAKDIIYDLFNACDASQYDCVEPNYIFYLAEKYGVKVEV